MPKAKKVERVKSTADSVVSEAFDMADELKDELQNWFDGLHENFQNGSKGEALQTAIDQIDSAQRVDDVPERLQGREVQYTPLKRKASRRDRLQQCIEMLNNAADIATSEADDLEDMKYDDEGNRDEDDRVNYPDAPDTEEERDALVDELRNFASECSDAATEWESVEFPGMYG